MKPQKFVLRMTAQVFVGVALLTALMLCVYGALGRFSQSALLGAVYTGALSVLSFFALGLTVQSITDTAGERERTDEEIERLSGKMEARMKLVRQARQLVLLALVIVGITVLRFEPLATILPLVFPSIALVAFQFLEKAFAKRK